MTIDHAVILAAGTGTRLQNSGKIIPKGFLQLGDRPIVVESLEHLIAAGITRVLIVTGHQFQYYQAIIPDYPGLIETVHNDVYANSGSFHSLLMAAEFIDGDFLLLESDILYEPSALEVILDYPGDNATLLSGRTGSGDEVYVETVDGLLHDMSKQRPSLGERIAGEFVGISKCTPVLFQALSEFASEQVARGQHMHYETDGFVGVKARVAMSCPKIEDLVWTEIDDEFHLRRARQRIYPKLTDLRDARRRQKECSVLHDYLSAEQVTAFRELGYIVVRQLFSPAEMADMEAWTDDLQAWPETPGKHMMYFETSSHDQKRILNRMENFAPYHPFFRNLFLGQRMVGAVEQLFGEPASMFKDKINFKMPGGDGFAPHQDVQAGWSRYSDIHITALVSIDSATIENGCLEIAPSFHDRGLVGSEWSPLTDSDMDGMRFEFVETEPGDAIFFDSYAPHRSGPNLTNKSRRVLYVTYNRASEGDHLTQYYADKRKSYPPDVERQGDGVYVFKV